MAIDSQPKRMAIAGHGPSPVASPTKYWRASVAGVLWPAVSVAATVLWEVEACGWYIAGATKQGTHENVTKMESYPQGCS